MDFRPELSWEFLTRDEIDAKSVRAFRNHIRHVKECSVYYKSIFESISPDDINSVEDIARIPLTSRAQLAGQSSRFLGVDPAQVVETVITAGTGGKPIPFIFSASDLDRIAYNQALHLHAAGISPADRIMLLVSLDRYSLDGMAQYRGAVILGANVMRIGVGTAMHQVLHRYLQFFKPTALVGVPSVLRSIGLDLKEKGYDTAGSAVEKLLCIGESIADRSLGKNAVGSALEQLWGAKAFSMYSSTETAVAYCDCAGQAGLHGHPELVYTEIVDKNGRPVSDGTVGELVATPFGVEGVPLVRYRTGDMTFKLPGTCTCGRNSCRIGPVLGRKSQLFTCNGTVVYPLLLTNALDSVEEVKDYLVILENETGRTDTVTIHVAAPPAALEKIGAAVREATGVHLQMLVSNIPTIRSLRKGSAKKIPILDRRIKPEETGA